MDFWIVQNGERQGPFSDYLIREQIRNSELDGTVLAWCVGMEEWQPLSAISWFSQEFARKQQEEIAIERAVKPPILLPAPRAAASHGTLIRRFIARWLDLGIYSALVWLGLWAAAFDVGALSRSLLFLSMHYAPWFILESWLLSKTGTTPGKWLLGLSVTNLNGSRLSFRQASRRSALIWIGGIGFGLSFFALVCQALSWWNVRRAGATFWDLAGGHRIHHRPVRPSRIFLLVALYWIALQLRFAVLAPYVMPEVLETFPALKESYESSPPWQLEPRKSLSP